MSSECLGQLVKLVSQDHWVKVNLPAVKIYKMAFVYYSYSTTPAMILADFNKTEMIWIVY